MSRFWQYHPGVSPHHATIERLNVIVDLQFETNDLLRHLIRQEHHVALDLTALTQAVAADNDVEHSAVILLEQISAQLTAALANTTDPATQAAVQSIADQINAQASNLANAIVANTPPPEPGQAPPVVPPPSEQPPTGIIPGGDSPDGAGKPLYTVDGDATTDTGSWSKTGLVTTDDRPLFTFEQDTPGGPPAGDGADGIWHVYTGESHPAVDPGNPLPVQTPPPAETGPDGQPVVPAPVGGDGQPVPTPDPVTPPVVTDPAEVPAVFSTGPDGQPIVTPADPAAPAV